MEPNPTKPVPKTIALGLTKTTPDGRIISKNHPNPYGVTRKKRPYRSMKKERAALLPKLYRPRNPHPQNGDFQCPVLWCEKAFTRKAGLMNHMTRDGGHAHHALHDNGDGTFSRLGSLGDMASGPQLPEDASGSNRAEQPGPPYNTSERLPLPEDVSSSNGAEQELEGYLEQAVQAGLDAYLAENEMA